jgi:S1-C subfamily serine protease
MLEKRYERYLLVGLGALLAILAVLIYEAVTPDPRELTQEDIDAAVAYTLDNLPPKPAASAVAYEVIRPSVVLVRRLAGEGEDQVEEGVGTGVVVVNTGAILTSLHVVIFAEQIQVVFDDGFETSATLVSAQPEQDLAIIQVDVVPEGLVPATLATTRGLRPGDEVVAVGHPFGIGESTSAGVVSGLGRTYVSEDGETLLSDLIQFDAAVNPGNSGGPLVNMNGEVIGIVCSIYNPNNERVFVGIGFAVPIETAASGFGQLPY